MPNAWIDALKKWNEGKGMWCLPKKGTKDYDEVRALMPPKTEKPKKEPKAPKAAKGETPLPKIAEGTTREQLMEMLESYTEERRRLSTVKGAKLRKGMDRIDKLEGQVKEKIKEMDAATPTPKAKRVIKVSKKVHEAAAPAPKKDETAEEEEMKKKAEAAVQEAVNKFVQRSKSENRSYLQSRRRAIEKKVYKETLDRLREEAREKKKEKVSAIIADRVQKKKLKNIYGEL